MSETRPRAHPLSEELRRLADMLEMDWDHVELLDEVRKRALRRAADALDDSHGIGTALEARYNEAQEQLQAADPMGMLKRMEELREQLRAVTAKQDEQFRQFVEMGNKLQAVMAERDYFLAECKLLNAVADKCEPKFSKEYARARAALAEETTDDL